MARSSSSRMETTCCPRGDAVSPRSSRSWTTIAVDESVKPIAAMNATIGVMPSATPTPVSTVPQAITCATPSPKICPRRFHSRDGCISSPITNRNMTTPSSAVWRIDCGSAKSASP
jgi:hypothetical protein